ncbi:MAG: ASKHA domain-containing protein [Armatimonadota bacterium]
MIRVSFKPGGESGEVAPGTTVLDAAESLGVSITAPCGGRGRCGRCRVIVTNGCAPPTQAEHDLLTGEELRNGFRLACEAVLISDTQIIVPSDSRTVEGKILSEDSWQQLELAPNVRGERLDLPEPSLADQRSDAARIADGLRIPVESLRVAHAALTEMPAVLRGNGFSVCTILVGDSLAAVRPPGVVPCCLGAAVVIGTTSVVCYLVDLRTGERIATASDLNPQARHGHDLISRIEYVQSSPSGLEEMRRLIVDLINRLLSQAVAEVGARRRDVYEVTVVGNTCMHHLFLGLDPRNIARAPYIPVTAQPLAISPEEAGLAIHPAGSVYCLPVIAGFVGADTVGVLLATRMTEREEPTLAIDIGTNGEVMVWSGERLLVTSCAAGPAFEGGEISNGVRAAAGAIERVWLRNGSVGYTTIGGARPNGICGSGIFDMVAALLDSGAVDATGRMADAGAAARLPEGIAARLRGEGSQREFVLVPSTNNGSGEVVFTQKDVREVQLAKGAVRAAVELLCAEAGIGAGDLHEVLLAGAFGNYIDRRSALRMGLLPEVPLERIRGIGNAAGAGALAALISTRERQRAIEIVARAEHVELMANPHFQMVFADAMMFPDAL